jgi:hypothetical protein
VTPDSPLGKQVREWLAAGRRAADDSGLPWFLAALRGVRDADPRVALLAALKPYASGLPGLADEQARAALLAALRDQAG